MIITNNIKIENTNAEKIKYSIIEKLNFDVFIDNALDTYIVTLLQSHVAKAGCNAEKTGNRDAKRATMNEIIIFDILRFTETTPYNYKIYFAPSTCSSLVEYSVVFGWATKISSSHKPSTSFLRIVGSPLAST